MPTDSQVLASLVNARNALKRARARAYNQYNEAKRGALALFGKRETDVDRASYDCAMRRAEVALSEAEDKACARYAARLENIRAQAGQWADLVPSPSKSRERS